MVWQAYKEVRANGGSGGIDKMSWEYLAQNAGTELYKLWNRLTSGCYFPQAVKQVGIPKKDGSTRLLGIPTLLDRIAQQVVRVHLERILEPQFHHYSFGYRPHRNCHQAVKQAYSNTLNHDFAIDLDIKGFFDNIDHELLMKALAHYCKDKWVLMYVERWLKAGIVHQDGNFAPSLTGTPQGGVISPLLANLFLHVVFDKWMEKYHSEKPFERYADDIIIHCKTERQALFMLKQIEQRLQSCKLQMHEHKTKVINIRGVAQKQYPKGFDFLGFTIRAGAYNHKGTIKAMPGIFVSRKSKMSIVQKFKDMVIHKRRKPLEVIARMVNPVARGIINYYHKFHNKDMRVVWKQLNARLLKWVKWEKDLYKKAAIRYLKTKYQEQPNLFVHWLLVRP